jgi:predicted transcriptional regulator
MERGLLATLSPNEEGTLRRIASGLSTSALLPTRHIRRLKSLHLIEQVGDELRLTAVGRQRCARFPRNAALYQPGSADELNEALVHFFTGQRR